MSRDFLAFFISLLQPIYAPDKQVKMVALKISFCGDIRIFWQASPLKKGSINEIKNAKKSHGTVTLNFEWKQAVSQLGKVALIYVVLLLL